MEVCDKYSCQCSCKKIHNNCGVLHMSSPLLDGESNG